MRRIGLILLATLVLVWAILAVALDSPSLELGSGGGGVAQGASSPECLPKTIEHSARLAGSAVAVSPAPGTDTASPHTQISFLGAPADDLEDVSAVGARSGRHAGRLLAYSQGDGASFLPDAPFGAGEEVSVSASVREGAHTHPLSFSFTTDTPYATAHAREFPNPQAPAGDYASFSTLPGEHPPLLSVSGADGDPAAGDLFTTNGPGPGQYGPLIYTPQGQLVWFEHLPGGETAEDLSVQEYEGGRDLTWWRGHVLELGFGEGEDLVMNSRYEVVAKVRAGNGLRADLHDFQLAGDGVAYITAYNPIRCDLAPLQGARDGSIIDTAVQEIDMRTGLVRWEWHSLDHIGASESETPASTDATPWDWFHINSIDPEPDGDILISARNTWAAYQLEGVGGRVLWRLGGTKSSFKMGPGTTTAWQHDARMLPDGEVTIFDDGSNPPIHSQSRAIRIALGLSTHEARLSSALEHTPALLAPSQGNMQTLADGDTLVDYGGIPQLSEYSPGGALLFDAHLPYDMSSYRGFRYPWSATPAAPPSLAAALNNTGEETIVHASWDGATTVASWRVLAGASRSSLAALATIPASGFESSAILPRKYAFASVQALDASGRTLASSAVVGVSSYAASLTEGRAG
jgi:hypothetical protein